MEAALSTMLPGVKIHDVHKGADKMDDGAVLDHHPLGPAGRAGGIDHIGRVGGLAYVVLRGRLGEGIDEIAHNDIHGIAAFIDELGGNDGRFGPALTEHIFDPFARKVGIDGQKGPARL